VVQAWRAHLEVERVLAEVDEVDPEGAHHVDLGQHAQGLLDLKDHLRQALDILTT
jgi:hypothetical protein